MRDHFSRELLVYKELYCQLKHWSPELYGHISVGDWDILVLEDLGPKSVPPWSARSAAGVMRCFGQFHVAGRQFQLPAWIEQPHEWLGPSYLWLWSLNPTEIEKTARSVGMPSEPAVDWFTTFGPLFANMARLLLDGGSHSQLLHGDVRSDNLRWRAGRLYLFDWSLVVVGAPELDVATFAQSIAVESELKPQDLIKYYEEINPLNPQLLTAAICAAASFFGDQAWREEIPEVPRLRAFQRLQFLVCLGWAIQRLMLPTPPWLPTLTKLTAMLP
jgi:Ser/Thr protein kinase RdoA (MazF antagonist)